MNKAEYKKAYAMARMIGYYQSKNPSKSEIALAYALHHRLRIDPLAAKAAHFKSGSNLASHFERKKNGHYVSMLEVKGIKDHHKYISFDGSIHYMRCLGFKSA